MNAYVNISNELRNFFSTNKIFKLLLPLDIIIMFVGLGLLVLTRVFGVSVGPFISVLAYWAFIIGLLLTYASMKEQFLYIGLFGYGAINLIQVLKQLFSYSSLYWSGLFTLAVYAGLGYMILRRTMVAPSNNDANTNAN